VAGNAPRAGSRHDARCHDRKLQVARWGYGGRTINTLRLGARCFDFQPFSAGEFVSALSPGQPELLGLYADPEGWAGEIILNVADSAKFSSDRTIAEYAAEIWDTKPCRYHSGDRMVPQMMAPDQIEVTR
jgi:Carbohydrate phosphorylase